MADATTENTAAVETSDDSTNTEAAATEATAPETPNPAEGEASLGDAGKKAIDAMKAERNEARRQLRETNDRMAALEAKLNGKEAEHQAAVEAQRVKDEALAAANERILKAEVRAAAAGKLNDPADALAYIDLSSFEVSDDGSVDSDAIGSAITDLITRKPYLGAQGQRFQGSADGGARNDAAKVAQLGQADLSRMTPEQIAEAHEKGQFDDLLGRS